MLIVGGPFQEWLSVHISFPGPNQSQEAVATQGRRDQVLGLLGTVE